MSSTKLPKKTHQNVRLVHFDRTQSGPELLRYIAAYQAHPAGSLGKGLGDLGIILQDPEGQDKLDDKDKWLTLPCSRETTALLSQWKEALGQYFVSALVRN